MFSLLTAEVVVHSSGSSNDCTALTALLIDSLGIGGPERLSQLETASILSEALVVLLGLIAGVTGNGFDRSIRL